MLVRNTSVMVLIVVTTWLYTLLASFKAIAVICYGPSVISVTVTKGGHPRGGGLYETSRTIRRGVTESRRKFSM